MTLEQLQCRHGEVLFVTRASWPKTLAFVFGEPGNYHLVKFRQVNGELVGFASLSRDDGGDGWQHVPLAEIQARVLRGVRDLFRSIKVEWDKHLTLVHMGGYKPCGPGRSDLASQEVGEVAQTGIAGRPCGTVRS